jgi:transcriptional regulator with XRE-family HTH domain
MQYKNITQAELLRVLSVKTRSQVNDWYLSKKKIPASHILEIINQYPELNSEWFTNGVGPMLKEELNDPEFKVLKEPPESYHINKVCPMCEEKDKLIGVLTQRIADKEEMIELLRGKTGLVGCG